MSLLRKIKSMIKRAVVTKSNPDTGNYLIAQISYLGKTGDMEVLFPYGMNAQLPVNAQVLCFNVEGMEENKIGIGYNPASRINVAAEGEVSFGNPLTGSALFFREDGSMQILALGATVRKLIDERLITKYNSHVHPDPVSGNTGVPTVTIAVDDETTTDFQAS